MKCIYVCVCVLSLNETKRNKIETLYVPIQNYKKKNENNKFLANKTKFRSNRKRKRSSTALFKENEIKIIR